jgi:hypothetical protein
MKSYLIRPAGALALALALASCGGGDDNKFTVEGTVENLLYGDLVLQNNGGQDLVVKPAAKAGDNVRFAFPNKIEYGDLYKVTVKTNPPHQTCEPLSNTYTDTAGRLSEIDVRLGCRVNEFAIGGTITGLNKDTTGLVLTNGSNTGTYTPSLGALEGDKPFTYQLPVKIPYNVTYGVTVLTQPKGRFCTVANPSGTVGDKDIDNVNVTCVPA